jgi:hypothetical protein
MTGTQKNSEIIVLKKLSHISKTYIIIIFNLVGFVNDCSVVTFFVIHARREFFRDEFEDFILVVITLNILNSFL